MGKAPNGLGKFSGKVGGVVFAISNGEQIVRAYQPVVNNPKSSGQQNQRAKGNLVGRISQITPWQILEGLGTNRRMRRGRFLSLCLNRTTVAPVAGSPNSINASLADTDFIFSEGAIVPTIQSVTTTATDSVVTMELQKIAGVSDADFNASGVLAVAVIMDVDGTYEKILYKFVSSSDFVGGSYTLSLPNPSSRAYNVSFYLAPFKTDDGVSLKTKTDPLMGENNSFNAILTNNPSAIPLVWGMSFLTGRKNFTPAAKDANAKKK